MGSISKDDGQYFADFCDGEACFAIARSGEESHRCDFVVRMRADDADLVLHLRDVVGQGSVRWHRTGARGHPIVQWRTGSKAGCQRVVDILTAFPLRGKKRADFEVWAEALWWWRSSEPDRWARMMLLKEKLTEQRKYVDVLGDDRQAILDR